VSASDANTPAASAPALHDAAFLRTVLESVPAFVVWLDTERRILYINRLQPGFTLEQVIGRPVEDFIDRREHERLRQAIDAALRTNEPQTYTILGSADAAGATAHYQSRAVPVSYGDNQRGVCLIAVEVTEHVERAKALSESEEKLRLLVEATGIGLWSWDVKTDKVEWNSGMYKLMGTEPMTPQQYLERAVHPEDRALMLTSLRGVPDCGGDYNPHRIVRPDGSVRWVMPTGRTQRDEHGDPTRLLGGSLDITTQRQMEERLRAAQKIDAVGALTAGVAHNFNNMLAVIMPALDLLQRDATDAQKHLLLDAAHAARRASELVTQLMTFAGQRQEGERKLQDITPIVERAVSMCRRTFASQISLDVATIGVPGLVRCDAAALEQVIVNLLINARDAVLRAHGDSPRVRVEISETSAAGPAAARDAAQPHLRIAVTDEGIGMSKQVKEHLFEPFFTTKEAGRGTGLGLATSYGIIRDHGGFISFDSTEGKGTTASVYLPIEAEKPRAHEPHPTESQDSRRGTVLVIDDELAVRSVVEEVLRMCGHAALSAANASSVQQLFATGAKPDLILLDRSMPGFPVKAALAQLRAHAPQAPILFFTGQDVPDAERSLVEGVLYKPLSLSELSDAVGHWLARGASGTAR
jgi:PAS domain S-box-containing protein